MGNARIIASEKFGLDNGLRIDMMQTRFGDLEFFVLVDGEVWRQTSDIVKATKGLENCHGVADAVERLVAAL